MSSFIKHLHYLTVAFQNTFFCTSLVHMSILWQILWQYFTRLMLKCFILIFELQMCGSKGSVKDTDGQPGSMGERSNQFHTYCCLLRVHNNSAEPALFDIVSVSCSWGWLLLDQSAWCSTCRLQWCFTSTWKKRSRKHFFEQWKCLHCSPLL